MLISDDFKTLSGCVVQAGQAHGPPNRLMAAHFPAWQRPLERPGKEEGRDSMLAQAFLSSAVAAPQPPQRPPPRREGGMLRKKKPLPSLPERRSSPQATRGGQQGEQQGEVWRTTSGRAVQQLEGRSARDCRSERLKGSCGPRDGSQGEAVRGEGSASGALGGDVGQTNF